MKNVLIILLFLIFGIQLFGQHSNTSMSFRVLTKDNNLVSGLNASDIEIYLGRKKLEVVSLEQVKNEQLDIILMIDSSGSQKKVFPLAKIFARAFVESILVNKKDSVSIVTFAESESVEQEFSTDRAKTIEEIKKLEFKPTKGANTSIWDSAESTLNFSTNFQRKNKRIIVLISDGFDFTSKMDFEKLIEHLIEQQIEVYSVGMGDNEFNGIEAKYLTRLSQETGGSAYLPQSEEDLKKTIVQMEKALRSNYHVTFSTNEVKQGKSLSKMRIKIVKPDLRKQKLEIIQPKGFFFPTLK
jgi:VWFA-related protein